MRTRSLTLAAAAAMLFGVGLFGGCGASQGPAAAADGTTTPGAPSATFTPVGTGDVYMAPPTVSVPGLPDLPGLGHVKAVVHGNSAEISFDPFPGAVDYRVYVQPDPSAVRLTAEGAFEGVN